MYVFLGPKSNEEPESVFKMPAGVGRRSLFVVSLPIKVLLYLTVPDCRRPRWRKYVILTFSLSLVWLSVFSYIMVWMITVIGNTLSSAQLVWLLLFYNLLFYKCTLYTCCVVCVLDDAWDYDKTEVDDWWVRFIWVSPVLTKKFIEVYDSLWIKFRISINIIQKPTRRYLLISLQYLISVFYFCVFLWFHFWISSIWFGCICTE